MDRRGALQFVRRHGVVLESAHSGVVTFADAAAGERIRGSWWRHPKSHQIFQLTRAVRDSPDVLVCRLVADKITYVHRDLWPALVRLASQIGPRRLDAIHEIHTASGKHVLHVTRFPAWVPPDVRQAAKRLTLQEARAALDRWPPFTRR